VHRAGGINGAFHRLACEDFRGFARTRHVIDAEAAGKRLLIRYINGNLGWLQKLLPPGTDLRIASRGFRNLGEFVTTVRASINLAIAFDALKAKVVAGGAISDAIESLRPGVDGLVEARRARLMAREDLKKT